MSCEKLQSTTSECAQGQPAGSEEMVQLAAIAMDLALNCDKYKKTHTSRILADLSGESEIPDFLRKNREKQEILVRHGLLTKVVD